MRGRRGRRRVALIVWAAFAFVTWNVVFDRQVYLAAVEFTQQQIERYQRGDPVASIDDAFSPRVGHAARRASVWGGAVLAAGAAVAAFAARERPKR
jgi:hypothetical protein